MYKNIIIITLLIIFSLSSMQAHEEELSYIYIESFDIGNGYNLVVKIPNYLPPLLPANNTIHLNLSVYNGTYQEGVMPVMHVTYNVKVQDSNGNLLNLFGTNQDIHSMQGSLQLNLTFPGKGKYIINVQVKSIGMEEMGSLIGQFKNVSFPLYLGVSPDYTLVKYAEIGRGYKLIFQVYPNNASLNKKITLAVYNETNGDIELVHHVTYQIIIKDSNGKVLLNSTELHIEQGVYIFTYNFPGAGNYTITVQVVSIGHPNEHEFVSGFTPVTFNLDIQGSNLNFNYIYVVIIIIILFAILIIYLFNKKRTK